MPAYNAGTAFLQIVPSFRGFNKIMQAEAQRAGRSAGGSFTGEFDRAVREAGANVPVGPSQAKAEKAGQDAGGAFATAFRKRVEAAQKALGDVEIGVSTSEAEQKVKDLRAKIAAELGSLKNARVGVDVTESAAFEQVAALREQLHALASESPNIGVRVNSGKALTELTAIQTAVNHLDGQNPTITPTVNTTRSVTAINSLYLALAGLAPALVPIGAAAIPAFFGLGQAAGAAALGVGAVTIALKPTIEAIKLAGKASGGSEADIERFNQAMAKLSPQGRTFVQFVTGELLPAFRGIGLEVQGAFLPGLQRGLAAALPLMGTFRQILVQAALGMADLADKTGRALSTPFYENFFRFLRDSVRQDINLIGTVLGNLTKGLLGLFQAFNPLAQSMGNALVNLSARFAAFGASAAAGTNETFNRFLGYLRETLPLVRDFFSALARASGNLIVGFAPLGNVVLPLLTNLLNVIAKMPPSLLASMAAGFYTLALSIKAMIVVNNVLAAFAAFRASLITTGVTAKATDILLRATIIGFLAGLVVSLVVAYQTSETLRNKVNAAFRAVAAVALQVWQAIKPTMEAIGQGLLAAGNAAVGFGQKVGPYFVAAGRAIADFWNGIARPALSAFAGFITGPVASGISGFYNTILVPTFHAAGVVISAWVSAAKVAFQAYATVLTTVLFPAVRLLGPIFKAAFDVASAVISTWVSITRGTFQTYAAVLTTVLFPAVRLVGTVFKAAFEVAGLVVSAFMTTARAVLQILVGYFNSVLLPEIRLIGAVFRTEFNIAQAVVSAFVSVARPVLAALVSFLSAVFSPAVRLIGTVFRSEFAVASTVVSTFAAVARPALSAFASVLSTVLFPVVRLVGTVFRTEWAVASAVIGGFVSAARASLQALVGVFNSVLFPVIRTIAVVFRTELNIATAVVNGFVSAARVAFGAYGTVINTVVTVVRTLQSVHKQVMDAIRAVVEGDVGAIRNTLSGWATFMQGVLTPVFRAFQTAVSAVFNAVRAVVTTEITAVRTVLSTLIAFMQGAVSAGFRGLQTVVTTVFTAIRAYINTEITAVRAVFTALVAFMQGPFAAGFRALQALVNLVFTTIRNYITLHITAVRAVFTAFIAFMQGPMSTAFRSLQTLISTVFNAIRTVITTQVNAVRTVFSSLIAYLQGPVAAGFHAYQSLVANVFNAVRNTISSATQAIVGTFGRLRDAVNSLGDNFRNAVQNIGNAWEGLREAARKPVEFVVNVVLGGLAKGINTIGNVFGLKDVPVPHFYSGGIAETGGVFPGYTPGRDTGLIAVGGGEAIMRPEWTRAMGPDYVNSMNAAARTGGVSAVKRILGIPGFDIGGIVGGIKKKATSLVKGAANIPQKVWDVLTDPTKAFKEAMFPVLKLLGNMPGKDTQFGKILTAIPRKFVDLALGKVKDGLGGLIGKILPGFGGGGGPVNPGLAGALQFAYSQVGKPYIWGGVGPEGYDCSGFMSAIANVIQGRYPYSRRFATPSFATSSTAGGFVPGANGAFSIGVKLGNPGHTAGTLNGVNVESRGGRGVLVGPSARGTFDSYFNRYYHLAGYARGGVVTRADRRRGDPPADLIDPRGKDPIPLRDLLDPSKHLLFDQGGYLPPGVTLAINKTGRPERIFTEGQWSDLSRSVRSNSAPAVEAGPMVSIGAQYVTPDRSNRDLAEELYWMSKGRG